MKKTLLIIVIINMVLTGCANVKVDTEVKSIPAAAAIPVQGNNPLLVEFNQTNDFSNLKEKHVPEALNHVLIKADEMVAAILSISAEERTFANTISIQDDMEAVIGRTVYPIYLMGQVHPEKAVRTACDSAVIKYEKWSTDLSLNEDLYKAVKSFSTSEEAVSLEGIDKKYLDDLLKNYRRNGFNLSKEKRDELKIIKNRLSEIGLEFDKNITEYTDTLLTDQAGIEGLPQWYQDKMAAGEGVYKIDISYPSRSVFMKYSKSESARKALTEKYLNRGKNNVDVIPKLVAEHHKMAELLGYKSYADYLLEDRMPKNPQTVWDFEADLIKNLRPKAVAEHNDLLSIKNAETGTENTDINYWNMFYYENILDEQKYNLDEEEIKQYFELNNVLDGMFIITQKMLGLRYEKIDNPSVWHTDVSMYSVFDTGTDKLLGYFYLDLFPREGKYSHAAHFGISKGKMTEKGYQYPIASLVCNFPKPAEDRPSLMSHTQEVSTFFHEFGHLLHGMVTDVKYWGYSGTAVDRDFVEAPSQIFENWIWEKESVNIFARHYETNEPIPDDLLDRMLIAKNRSTGNDFSFQVFLGSLDLTLFESWRPEDEESVLDVARRLHREILTWNETPNTARIASFGHLNGYSASYYGYAWSNVLAQDMFSVFKKEGILNPETGLRFRRQVLAPGGTRDPMELVVDFLGREPDSRALVDSWGLNE